MRKSPDVFNLKIIDEGKQNVFERWTNSQGWLGLVALIILNVIGLINKWLPISIILHIFGVNFCE